MANTYHDTPLKDGNGDIHFPRTDLASVYNTGGTKTAEQIIAELQAENEALITSLTANGKKYQADYQDTKYGFTVDGVFYPFGSGAELLWTNSAPTVGFNAQTVALDLSEYVGVAIIGKRLTTQDTLSRTVCIGAKGNSNYNFLVATDDNLNAISRGFKASDTGVVFTSATGASDTGTITFLNVNVIPLYIFGLKNMLGFEDYIN